MHIQAPILCSFSRNNDINSNSSRSNSDFELVASSPHSMYNSGFSSSNEEVQFSSKNVNNGNNSECVQFMQIMDSNLNQDQPPNSQLLARENENLKKQLEWMKIGLTKKDQEKERLEQELNQNRSVMARILACQIDGKRKEREAAAHANATATIINFQPIRDIWEELSSDSSSSLPPTSQILTNFHLSMRRQDNPPQTKNLNFDIWQEPEDIDNDEENPNQLPPLDIWREPEEGDENDEENLETETGGELRNNIWAEEEESNGDEILIQLDFEQNGDNANEEIIQEELIQQAQNIMPLITDEQQEMASAQLLDQIEQIEQQQINDDPTDQNTISTLYDVYESALESLNVSRSASPIPTSSGTNSNLFSFASDPIQHSSLISAPSLISSIPMTQNSNEHQLLPANATVENVIQDHFHPSEPSDNEQREEDPIASLAFQELRRDILDIRNAMGNKIEDIERRMEERFVNFQMEELVRTFNTRMDQIETRIRSMDYMAEEFRNRNDQSLENVDFDRRLANLEQKLQRIEECPPFKKSFLMEYANTLGEINLNQELIIRNSFTYSDDFKRLVFSGASIGLNGIVVNASAQIQDYPTRFLDIIIQNAINARNSEALIPFFVINFADNKAKWPSTLNQIDEQNNIFDLQTTSQNTQLMHYTVHNQGIKKRAICADKIIYSFRNLNSKAKFVMEVFFHSQEEIYKKTGAFTIRCLN